jgi:hypothetical protein
MVPVCDSPSDWSRWAPAGRRFGAVAAVLGRLPIGNGCNGGSVGLRSSREGLRPSSWSCF